MEEHLAEPVPSRDEITKHWLLNLTVEFPIRLTLLFPRVETLGLNTKAVPHCTAEDYARNLVELFDSGMIELSSELAEDDVTSRSGVSRILERFLALAEDYRRWQCLRPGDPASLKIDRNPAVQVDFKLTALGGEAWEKLAEPDWERFISASTYGAVEDQGTETGELISPDRDLDRVHGVVSRG